MKIPREKQISFLEKAISDTRDRRLLWNRPMSDCVAASYAFPGIVLDSEGVFSCIFPSKIKGEFWIAMCQDGRVRGAIGTETSHMEHFSYKDAEIGVLLTRLFYLLFDERPSANKLIDSFLAQEPQQAPDPSE